MMKLLLLTLLCLCAAFQTTAFAPRPAALARPVMTPLSTTTSLNVFGNKKNAAAKAKAAEEAAQYWAGEWVCKDCGYIYNRVRNNQAS